MLTFNLKKEWFDKIKNGEKTHEYREVKDYWTDRLLKELYKINKKSQGYESTKYIFLTTLEVNNLSFSLPTCKICFMNGMLSEEIKPRMYAKLNRIKIVNGINTDLKIDKNVYDIEFELIGEVLKK